MVGFFVLLSGHIALAALDHHLHMQFAVLVERRDMKLGIQDLHIGVSDDVRRCDLFLACDVQAQSMRLLTVHLEAERLEVQHDVRHIVPDARNRGKLMQNAVDTD